MRSRGGTRFRLFPQPPFLKQYRNPVTVRVSSPAGSVGPGPADDRMYVVSPIGKSRPYGIVPGLYDSPFLYLPSWDGPIATPAMPDVSGHFDSIDANSSEFEAAHAYACVRWVLDVWECYFGKSIGWHFAPDYEMLEISLYPDFDNAQAGYGFLEIGADFTATAHKSFGLNFDVVAHELGHLIVYSLLGVPNLGRNTGEYEGFHESAADLVALIAAANFEPVLDELFANTRGNLYALNELNRFAELSEQTQIRLACNLVKMSQFRDGWDDEHDLSLPLTGAIFDILCDIYHRLLIERGLITRGLATLVSDEGRLGVNESRIQAGFDAAFSRNSDGFAQALRNARERVGLYLAETWQRLAADNLTYVRVAEVLLTVDHELAGGRFAEAILSSFRWREIGQISVGPRTETGSQKKGSHLRSARSAVPEHGRRRQCLSYWERWTLARGG